MDSDVKKATFVYISDGDDNEEIVLYTENPLGNAASLSEEMEFQDMITNKNSMKRRKVKDDDAIECLGIKGMNGSNMPHGRSACMYFVGTDLLDEENFCKNCHCEACHRPVSECQRWSEHFHADVKNPYWRSVARFYTKEAEKWGGLDVVDEPQDCEIEFTDYAEVNEAFQKLDDSDWTAYWCESWKIANDPAKMKARECTGKADGMCDMKDRKDFFFLNKKTSECICAYHIIHRLGGRRSRNQKQVKYT